MVGVNLYKWTNGQPNTRKPLWLCHGGGTEDSVLVIAIISMHFYFSHLHRY